MSEWRGGRKECAYYEQCEVRDSRLHLQPSATCAFLHAASPAGALATRVHRGHRVKPHCRYFITISHLTNLTNRPGPYEPETIIY